MELVLRPATIDDAAVLYRWRNDPTVREASRQQSAFDFDSHLSWMKASLASSSRRLFIAEAGEKPVGTVRYDLHDGWYELSWTVAPEARGQGLGKRMVCMLAEMVPGPIFAEIRSGNMPSVRIAEAAGMRFEYEKDGILRYSSELKRL